MGNCDRETARALLKDLHPIHLINKIIFITLLILNATYIHISKSVIVIGVVVVAIMIVFISVIVSARILASLTQQMFAKNLLPILYYICCCCCYCMCKCAFFFCSCLILLINFYALRFDNMSLNFLFTYTTLSFYEMTVRNGVK